MQAAAICHRHIVTDLPGNAIPVIVPRFDVIDTDTLTILHENTAGIVPVEVLIVRPVSIKDEITDFNIADLFAAENTLELDIHPDQRRWWLVPVGLLMKVIAR